MNQYAQSTYTSAFVCRFSEQRDLSDHLQRHLWYMRVAEEKQPNEKPSSKRCKPIPACYTAEYNCKCPFPQCGSTFDRSDQLGTHLVDAHSLNTYGLEVHNMPRRFADPESRVQKELKRIVERTEKPKGDTSKSRAKKQSTCISGHGQAAIASTSASVKDSAS